MTTDDIITAILGREGGAYTNRAADRGGPTKWGITLSTLRQIHPEAQAADVAALTAPQARSLYLDLFVRRPGFDKIADDQLRSLLVDSGVLHGPAEPVRWLQHAVGIEPDGTLGPTTIAAVNSAHADTLFARVLAARLAFIGRLITREPSQAVFAAGWLARIAEFVTMA